MNELLDSWISDEKNFVIRFVKRQLLNLFKPLLQFQNQYNEEVSSMISEKEQLIHGLQEEMKGSMLESDLLKSRQNSLVNEVQNLRINERLVELEKNVRSNNNWIAKADQTLYHDDPYSLIDYTDFENHFRGSFDLIKDRQQEYLKYFSKCKYIVDVGCGRGEFLGLLKEKGINAEGVELYKPYVDYCRSNGLNVHLESGIDYLNKIPDESIDGIYMGQVVEHLSTKDLITMIRLSYKKLAPGSYLIMESPNPMTLAIFTHAFYIDPSHNKPVHPYLLQYLTQKAGFQQVTISFLPKSKLPEEFPKIVSESIDNLDEINCSIEKLSDLLYGYQDYAIIAQK